MFVSGCDLASSRRSVSRGVARKTARKKRKKKTTLAPASLARTHGRLRVQNVRDFPQSKLDSGINSPFLLNEHGDPQLLFHDFNEDNSSITEKRICYFFGK